MGFSGGRPQFQHIPQHHQTPSGRLLQHLQGGGDGDGVGVVGIINDHGPLRAGQQLAAHRRRLTGCQTSHNLLGAAACSQSGRRGSQGIGEIVATGQLQGDFTDGLTQPHPGALAGQTLVQHSLTADLRCVTKAKGQHRTGAHACQQREKEILGRQHCGALRWQQRQDLRLGFRNGFPGAQPPDMRLSDTGNDPHLRPDDLR